MKKILIIIIVTFLFNNIAKANCYDDLSWSWARNNLVTEFKFTNKGSKYIRITEIKVYASDGDKIISFKPNSLKKFSESKKTPLEKVEDIELLRALEIGQNIKTFSLKGDSFSVDVLDDYKRAEKQMNLDKFFRLYKI